MSKNTTTERLWQKVQKTDSCWLWTGAINNSGYGLFWYNKKMRLAHRIAYETIKGCIPEGMQLDHLCRVRQCVNPNHLEIVTSKVNTLRGEGVASNNAKKTHCPRGHSYSGDNLFFDKRGYRNCRECHRINSRLRYRSLADTMTVP
jgi:hypothetical protein